MRSPRILYLCSCWPHDKCHGGQLRALQVARALQQLGEVTLVVVGAHDVDPEVKMKSAAEFNLGREIEIVSSPALGLIDRARSVFDREFTNIHGYVAKPADEAWLLETLKNFDLVWFFKLRTANSFINSRWRRSVVDIDDLPSGMERSRLRETLRLPTRLRTTLRLFELLGHERHLWRRFDVLAVCSEIDRAEVDGRSPLHVIPNGFARPTVMPVRKPATPPRIGFMGLYSYLPNLEGMRWFIEKCWNQVEAQVPGVRLRLVGSGTDGPLKPVAPGIDCLGWVENPAEEVASWSLMIVPIQFGGGTRVKIADAFSRKCPLVSTRFGALGYDVEDGREIRLADDPAEFAAACVALIRDQEAANRMAERAYDAFLEKWTWAAIAPRAWDAAEDCLRLNFGRSS
jgi:glycosyltransferase involved in cell wall biosynthesis